MQFNLDCFRDVLKYCVDNIDYKELDGSWSIQYVDLTILYNASELDKYSKKDIMRSVIQLYQYNFITCLSYYPTDEPYIDRCSIKDVTISGYQFIEAVKEPSIWEKTKSVANKIGNHTINFIETTAHDIAVESAKQMITITMMGNL